MNIGAILLFLAGLGGTEVAVIIFVVFLLFGANRIPELAKGLGQGIREFKNATSEVKKEVEGSSTE